MASCRSTARVAEPGAAQQTIRGGEGQNVGQSRLMPESLLIANRGEIAVRIARTAGDLGVETVAVYAEDDAASLHTREEDRAVVRGASGVPAYLDVAAIIAPAQTGGCDAVHPGYGFLSEGAAFATTCQ